MNRTPARVLQFCPTALRKPWLLRAARLVIICLCLGWLYAWANPRVHPPHTRFGLAYGVAHGALMPMALPSLLMGNDVLIYSENNTGRSYKIGYIVGINVCGLIFFGSAFLRPKRKPASIGLPQSSQPRQISITSSGPSSQ